MAVVELNSTQPVAASPEAWLQRLYTQMVGRRPKYMKASRYYDGHHNLAFASKKFEETFGGLFGAFADNWCTLVAEAVEERLVPVGFRVARDAKADDGARKVWQDNDMDLQAQLAHNGALVHGFAYATAWFGEQGQGPELTVESAMQAIVARHPKMRNRRQAGLRTYVDEWDGHERAELFLPGFVFLFRAEHASADAVDPTSVRWAPDRKTVATAPDGWMENPLGVVPMVELANNARLYVSPSVGAGAFSEIGGIIPIQDAVNKLMADMIVASEFSAFMQRWMTGYEAQVDPETKQELPPPFKDMTGPGATVLFSNPEARFGQFEATDLSNFVKAIDMIVQHIASISRTPPHYLNASADRLSGESIKAAETGLVAKVRRKMTHFGVAWEELMRLAGQINGDSTLADAASAETIWADPESRTEAEHVDAALKKMSLGVPLQQLWEDLGYTPDQIARFAGMREQDALIKEMMAPPAPAVPPAAPDEQQQGGAGGADPRSGPLGNA